MELRQLMPRGFGVTRGCHLRTRLSTTYDLEFQTLLRCSRAQLGEEEVSGIASAFEQEFDFSRFLDLIEAHGVTPLVYRSLRSTCWDRLPTDVRLALEKSARAATGRCLFLTAELVRLLGLFDGAGIRAVPFKGPALAMATYGDIGLREFSDLDLLVRADDLGAVQELLVSQGYEPREHIVSAQRSLFLRHECEQGFTRSDNGILVEMHWRFAQGWFGFPFDLSTRWNNLVELELMGCRTWSFSAEDQLLLLCVHGAKHLWSNLKWVCDVAEWIRASPGLDWQVALREAAAVSNERTLLLGLGLAELLLDAPLPATVRQRIGRCSPLHSVMTGIERRLRTFESPRTLEVARFHLARRSGMVQKLRQAALLLASPTAADWASNSKSFPMLVLRRPFRLLWKYR
jgi:hypothetical protein